MTSHYQHEMTYHQRNLVDGCFEEGQYNAGISILNQIRNPNITPNAPYIRQLIFISMFPSTSKPAVGKDKDDFSSPTKLSNVIKNDKTSYQPTSTDTEAAIRLLTNYVLTNSPQSLLCALPCYPLNDNERRVLGDDIANKYATFNVIGVEENEDSEIARQASYLKQRKDCWDMLKDGVVKWEVETKTKRKQSSNARRRQRELLNKDISDDSDTEENSLNVIGKTAWPILEWLIRLFERDEALCEISSDRCSPSLLCHIKPNTVGTGPRTDIDIPLDIVFTCYSELEPRKMRLGMSLMIMLIHLAKSILLSASHLITGASMRLRSVTADVISAFLSDFSLKGVYLLFKIVLCDKFLSDFMKINDFSKNTPKPQARRAKPSQSSTADFSKQLLNASTKSISSSTSVAFPWALPSTARILQALASRPVDSSQAFAHNLIKYHLIIAYGSYKAQEFFEHKSIDADWIQFLRSHPIDGGNFIYFNVLTSDKEAKLKLANMCSILSASFQNWLHLMSSRV